MLKRVGLFLLVNFLVVTTISIIFSIFNIQPYLDSSGLNVTSLLIFCLLWGMIGSFISLLLSKQMAKWMMGVTIIDPKTTNPQLRPLLDMVERLAKEAKLPVCPEVGIYDSPEVNAFATGPSKRNSLVAVSSGLLRRMNNSQVEGVVAHELAHISNGDMVTMTLLQGIINAFVMFAARLIALVVVRAMRGDRQGEGSYGFAYYGIVMLLQMVLMLLGSIVIAAFSRWREFHADAGGARVAGKEKMIAALEGLQKMHSIQDPHNDQQEAFQAMKISSPGTMAMLFATHPPLEKRIQRLREAA